MQDALEPTVSRREFVKAGALTMLAGAVTKPQPQAYKIGAYYFPNFHVIFDRAFMDLRPTQGNENRVEEGWVGNYT